MSVSDESGTLSNASKEEIAREIKEIFSYVKVSSMKKNLACVINFLRFYSFIFRAPIVMIMC